MAFAVWVTVGFFESNVSGQFNVAGLTYHNSFTCIPLGLPSHTATTGPLLLTAGTPLGIALSSGPLLTRFEEAARKGELLPYVEIRLTRGSPADVLRLQKVRVRGVEPIAGTTMTRQVTLVQEY